MWLVQAMGIDATNGDKVMASLKSKNIPFIPVGVMPFSTEVTGLGGVELEAGKVMVYGSTKLVRLTKELGLSPGPSFDFLNFSVPLWQVNLPKAMLNQYATVVQIRDVIRSNSPCDAVFIRPAMDLKAFSGTVVKRDENWREFFENQFRTKDFDQNMLVAYSPVRNITKEWRVFIVDRQVVTASQYRSLGKLDPSPVVPVEVLKDAQFIAEHRWLPHDNCVMDVALTDEGEFGIVEFNCINASGLYEADVDKLIDTLNSTMV